MKYYKNICGLASQWRQKENNKFYILEFTTMLGNIEGMGKKDSFDGYYDIVNELERFNYSFEDYEEESVKCCFYENLYILRYLSYRAHGGPATKFGQL